jgi:hypothetical protein
LIRIGGYQVDLVLGLSLTSADVRWVLVEGLTAEGATVCRDTAEFDTLDDALAAVGDDRLHAIGVTWTNEAETAASALLDALAARGLADVITVSGQEAADFLAAGIADRGNYRDAAVCLVEPDLALVSLVDADGVTSTPVAASADDMLALLDLNHSQPEAIFVLGSADALDSIADGFHGAAVPVITAAEADLALARGATLAAAHAVNVLDARPARWRIPSGIAALTSVVAAAAVALVVSLSVALGGLGLPPDRHPTSTVAQQDTAATVEKPAVPTKAAPKLNTSPVLAHTMVVEAAAPVPQAQPEVEPPAAPPSEPPPAYVPPAPPVYVPPAPPPQPRLRDRIIERIPIINRFHEPRPYG